MLSWSTAEEIESDLFAVEKSIDGKDFTQIAQIKSQGTRQEGFSYSFVDLFPETGQSFYRLKIINMDGSYNFLETISTHSIPTTNFMISNFSSVNPSSDWSINLDVFTNGSLVYDWIAVDGMVLDHGLKRVSQGVNTLEFSLLDWPDGIYKLQMEIAGDQKSVTIQKLGNATMQVGLDKK